MKKFMLVLLLLLNVNITQANPLDGAFRVFRKIGYLGTIYAATYVIIQFLNSRNSTRNANIEYIPKDNTLKIVTDGKVTIQGHADAKGITIKTERLDPDRQNYSLLKPDAPAPNSTLKNITPLPTPNNSTQTRWQSFWRWITRSAHRTANEQANASVTTSAAEPPSQGTLSHALPTHDLSAVLTHNENHESRLQRLWRWITPHHAITHHIICIPQGINIDLHAKNKITMNGINGRIKACTTGGNIGITDSRGDIIVETPDKIDITNFGGDLTAADFKHLHATRSKSNELGTVTYDDEIQPIQPEYDRTRD